MHVRPSSHPEQIERCPFRNSPARMTSYTMNPKPGDRFRAPETSAWVAMVPAATCASRGRPRNTESRSAQRAGGSVSACLACVLVSLSSSSYSRCLSNSLRDGMLLNAAALGRNLSDGACAGKSRRRRIGLGTKVYPHNVVVAGQYSATAEFSHGSPYVQGSASPAWTASVAMRQDRCDQQQHCPLRYCSDAAGPASPLPRSRRKMRPRRTARR
jgi:hypothetical protein